MEDLGEALKAAHWLVDTYGLGDLIQGLPLSSLPALQSRVEASIVQAVEQYVGEEGSTPKPTNNDALRKATALLAKVYADETLGQLEREQLVDLIDTLRNSLAGTL